MTLRIDPDLKIFFQKAATEENRSLSNFIINAVLTYIKDHKDITWKKPEKQPYGDGMVHQKRHPKYTHSLIDSCAFDPGGEEEKCSRRLLARSDAGDLVIEIAHSVQKEIDHPNTPSDVKALARTLIYSIETSLTPDLHRRRAEIRRLIRGNAAKGKHENDADHIFDLYKHGGGYFITTDNRLLSLAGILFSKYFVTVLRPSDYEALL
ncbi:MAG: hypothetical protein JSW04_13950 [Desulfobacterales bacterium]|nr:MAG: hypothetical protein JSW04_13950 [Desulfobacterales bacterium]